MAISDKQTNKQTNKQTKRASAVIQGCRNESHVSASTEPLHQTTTKRSEQEAAVRPFRSPWPRLTVLFLSKTKAEHTFCLTPLFERKNRH